MRYMQVANWLEFQHYKDRNPPWIKLHNQLLENFEFSSLQDASKAHLICIWMLASRTNNKIPHDSKWVASKIGATSRVDFDALIKAGFLEFIEENQSLRSPEQTASTLQAQGKRLASLETEGETETEGEKKMKFPPTTEDVKAYCVDRQNGINAQAFVDHYQANGWMRGKAKIKDWKACVRTWEANGQHKPQRASKEFPGV